MCYTGHYHSPGCWSRINQALQARHLSLGGEPRLAEPETLVLMMLKPKTPQASPTTSLSFA